MPFGRVRPVSADRFPIEEGHVLAFARAIGDDNLAFRGPDAVAPPTFVQASAQWDPGYPLRPKLGQPWFGSAREPTGARRDPGADGGGTGLHAEQHYTYHRPLRVGDVLTATTRPGETWEKQGRRAGRLIFTESVTEFRDVNGELVVTARGVGVRTERPATG
jgi:N-terminal half of MaoC dehydratase